MRSIIRSLAAGTLLAGLILGSTSATAFAAGAGASTSTYAIDEAWCFDDVVQVYCFDIDGVVHFTATPDGQELGVITEREDVVIYRGGEVIGAYRTVTHDTFIYSDDRFELQSVGHTRSVDGDLTCVSTVVLRIADYELVVDHATAPACH